MRERPILMGEAEARVRRAVGFWRAVWDFPHLAWALIRMAA